MSDDAGPTIERPLVLLLNGPNLNLLGDREPELYGTTLLGEMVEDAVATAAGHGLRLQHVQSNHEGVLVDAIHAHRTHAAAIIINAGAFTHYAWSIHDALAAYDGVVVELHISNPQSREPWRGTSVVAPVATATISGLGPAGYSFAVDAVAHLLGGRE
ncbi:MAG TPA: type II 3-dehydroquinate dehydratase [Acidimicrobiales bacterium]